MTRFSCLALAVLLFAACDDPSNVGLGLVGDEGGTPEIVRVSLPLASLDQAERTGNANQSLAGITDDPVLGTIRAAAYLDFGSASVLNTNSTLSDFRASNVVGVTLELPVSYRYGDTLSTVRYALRSITAPFVATGAESDTSFAVGDVITTFEAQANATTVSVALPDDWVARLDTTLRGSNFLNTFNGFYLEPLSGNAVLGFRQFSVSAQSLASLTARSASDTVRYVANTGVTTISRSGAPSLPAGAMLLQDGFRHTLVLDVNDQVVNATYANAGLARATIELPTLSTLGDVGSYVRPPAFEDLQLVAIDADGNDVVSGTSLLILIEGELSDNTLRFSSARLQQLVQRNLLGNPLCYDETSTDCFGRLAIRFVPTANTIGAYVLTGEARAALTIIPTD